MHHPLLAIWGLTSTSWLVLWSVLAALTVLLMALLRIRWSNARPWRKCAILSLWVHVLLAFAATTVRIVAGAPDVGDDAPIRVTVVSASVVTEQPPEEEIAPVWELSADTPLIAPEVQPLEAPAIEPLEAPAREPLEAPQVEPREAPSLAPAPERQPLPSPAVHDVVQEEVSEAPPAATNESSESSRQEEARPEEVVNAPTPPDTVVPETYGDRFAEDRTSLVESLGGSVQTERAVHAALGWLAGAQSKNGRWDASKYGAGEERGVLGHNRQQAGIHADSGVSGLALLAFLGSGHTHLRGPYVAEVARGLEALRQIQRADGALHGDAQLFARMYCHSMATLAVCEAYALTGDERLEPIARRAVRYTLSMQHPSDGGWRYVRGHTGDTSQLGWQLMTLKSALLAGIDIPAVTWTRVETFLRRVRRGTSGGLAAYRPDGPPSRTMTAEAMFCRQLLPGTEVSTVDAGVCREATASILQEVPTTGNRNLYFWYYASLALHQNRHHSAEASEAWEDWNHALTTTLLTTQQDDGSWDSNTTWGGYGGRVYTTALTALCLEVYYRYSPPEALSGVAGREKWQSVRK